MAGHDLKFAAIFQQFRQPAVDELSALVAEGVGEVFLHLAARAAFLAAEQVEQAAPRRRASRIVGVDVVRDDALLGVADADEIAGEHGTASVPTPSPPQAGRRCFRPVIALSIVKRSF